MARLVVGGDLPVLLDLGAAFLLRAGDDLDHRLLDVRQGDEGLAQPGSPEGGLVHQVLQVRAGEAGGLPGDLLQVHILCQRLIAGMHSEDLLPALHVRPVKPTGTQQGGVQDVLPVGGGQHDDPLVCGKAVHFHQ